MKVAEVVTMLLEQDQEKDCAVNLLFGKDPVREVTHVMDGGLGKVEIIATVKNNGRIRDRD